MATASDPDTRERWRWSAHSEMAIQGPLSGFGDDLVQAWLEETQGLTLTLTGVVPETLDKIHALHAESEKHSTNSFICRNNNHAFAIKKIDSSWYLLESELASPYTITEEHAAQTRGGMSRTFELFVLKHKTPQICYPCPQPYMEVQDKAFCLLHAFNMALGMHILFGASVLSHIRQLEHTLLLRNLPHISLRHLYTPSIGRFNITILNHYLHYLSWNANYICYLHYSRTDLQQGQINRHLVENLTNAAAYKSAVLLISKNQSGQLHAKALRNIENVLPHTQNTWCLLDSENSHPIYLTTEENWHQLCGSILTIQSGSFWDHLAATSDLHLADPHIPLSPEPNINQNGSTVHMIDTAPLPQQHTRDEQINPATIPQGIEHAHLHAPAGISTRPHHTWHEHLKIITMNVRGLF
eukprot:1158154-Pelagomonas_calceolata.AAC.2